MLKLCYPRSLTCYWTSVAKDCRNTCHLRCGPSLHPAVCQSLPSDFVANIYSSHNGESWAQWRLGYKILQSCLCRWLSLVWVATVNYNLFSYSWPLTISVLKTGFLIPLWGTVLRWQRNPLVIIWVNPIRKERLSIAKATRKPFREGAHHFKLNQHAHPVQDSLMIIVSRKSGVNWNEKIFSILRILFKILKMHLKYLQIQKTPLSSLHVFYLHFTSPQLCLYILQVRVRLLQNGIIL